MFSRLTIMEVKPDKIDETIRIYRESVIPEAKKQRGFLGAYLLLDRKVAKGISLTLWSSEKDASANEDNLYYQEQLVKFLNFYSGPPIKEGYEVILQVTKKPGATRAKKGK